MSIWARATATNKSMWLYAATASLMLRIVVMIAFISSLDVAARLFGWFARIEMIFGFVAAEAVEAVDALLGTKGGDSPVGAVGIGLFIETASFLLYTILFYGLMRVSRPGQASGDGWWPTKSADKD